MIRPADWDLRALALLRSLTPEQVDAASRTLPQREYFLEVWRLAQCPSRDEHDAKTRETEGVELARELWDWATKK